MREDKAFEHEVDQAVAELRRATAGREPAAILAAAMRFAAEEAVRQRTRVGLFGAAAREQYLAADDRQRLGREAAARAPEGPLAQVVPFRRAAG